MVLLVGWRQQRFQVPSHRLHAFGVALDLPRDVERFGLLAQEPHRAALDQPATLGEHRCLDPRRHQVVEPLDPAPQIAHTEDLSGDEIGPRDVRHHHAGALPDLVQESDAHPIDDVVGDHRGDDLPPQAVAQDRLLEPLAQRLRNIAELLHHRGDHDEAIALHTRANEVIEDTFGPDHPALFAGRHRLAMVLADRGDLREAWELTGRRRAEQRARVDQLLSSLSEAESPTRLVRATGGDR